MFGLLMFFLLHCNYLQALRLKKNKDRLTIFILCSYRYFDDEVLFCYLKCNDTNFSPRCVRYQGC